MTPFEMGQMAGQMRKQASWQAPALGAGIGAAGGGLMNWMATPEGMHWTKRVLPGLLGGGALGGAIGQAGSSIGQGKGWVEGYGQGHSEAGAVIEEATEKLKKMNLGTGELPSAPPRERQRLFPEPENSWWVDGI